MIINYNVPVKQEMCPARLARQEYCFIENNKYKFFLGPKQSNCPSCLDVVAREARLSYNFKPIGVICEHFQ